VRPRLKQTTKDILPFELSKTVDQEQDFLVVVVAAVVI
jgi:hypothetical protein